MSINTTNINNTNPLYSEALQTRFPGYIGNSVLSNSTRTTPEQLANERTFLDQALANNPAMQQRSAMDAPTDNLLTNYWNNMRRVGTGLAYAGTHPGEMINNLIEWSKTSTTPVSDYINNILAPYNTRLSDFGTLPARDIIGNVLQGAWNNPFDATLDLVSLGVIGGIRRGLGLADRASDVERGVATISSEVARDTERLRGALRNTVDTAKRNNVDLERVIEAAETGRTVTRQEQEVLGQLREFSDLTDSMARRYSPETYLGPETTAITQNILRRRLGTNPDTTFAQVERDITPLLERVQSGNLSEVIDLARRGNNVAKEVVGAKVLYDQGRIFPVTHGLANVRRTGERAVKDGQRGAGQFARRLYGNSSYGDIANELRNPNEYLRNLETSYIDRSIARDLRSGNLGGQDIAATARYSRPAYIERELLEQGRLRDALAEIRDARLYDNDIVVDRNVLDQIRRQRGYDETALSGTARDLYNLGASTYTAQGSYLGANLATGLSNALMNSGANIIGDTIDAIRSRGNLSRALGTYRYEVPPSRLSNPVLNFARNTNRLLGGRLLGNIDRGIQNAFAEIAANAELRRQGVRATDRIDAINQMQRARLGETIQNVKRASLSYSPNVPGPRWVRDLAFAVNPFWRWLATAYQSNLWILRRSPQLANAVLIDTIANVGFDREMQNRMQLNVNLNRPYTSFKIDPKTGQMKEMSAEFVPLTTTIRMFDVQGANFGPSVPFFTAITNAMGGKDRYGNLLKRPDNDGVITQVVGNERYQYIPGQGLRRVSSGMGDEVLTAALRETFGVFNLANRTLLPAIAPVISPTGEYYQPYGSALFGSFDRTTQGNFISGGNPNSPRNFDDVIRSFSGKYEVPYHESYDEFRQAPLRAQTQRQFWRARARSQHRMNNPR